MSLETEYLKTMLKRFEEQKELGGKTLGQLSEKELHFQLNETSNSIAMLVQHLHGNMLSRWTAFLTEDGEKAWRMRDAEFEAQTASKARIEALWKEGWGVLFDTLCSLQPDDLLKTVTIRSQLLSVADAINRQLAHYSHHVGQIVFLGKYLKAGDWQTLSIPKGGSQNFNDRLINKPKGL